MKKSYQLNLKYKLRKIVKDDQMNVGEYYGS